MDVENWIVQLREKILELCILNILRKKEYYGYNLVKNLISIQGLDAKEGSIYPLLSRLKFQNMVKTRLEESNEGPARKYYSLTEEGEKFIEIINAYFTDLTKEVSLLILGEENDNMDR